MVWLSNTLVSVPFAVMVIAAASVGKTKPSHSLVIILQESLKKPVNNDREFIMDLLGDFPRVFHSIPLFVVTLRHSIQQTEIMQVECKQAVGSGKV